MWTTAEAAPCEHQPLSQLSGLPRAPISEGDLAPAGIRLHRMVDRTGQGA
jgi:hypothetical protein